MSESVLDALDRRLHDVTTYQLARLRACRGPLSLHAELASELRHDLEDIRRRLEVEREVIESLHLTTDRASVDTVRIIDLSERYTKAKVAYREALLESKRAVIAKNASRYELDTSRDTDKGGQGSDDRVNGGDDRGSEVFGTGADDAVQTKTNEVTDALRRTTQVMQAELERSVLSVQMLESSTETLRSTQTLYSTYTSLLSSSSALVKALERADWYDRLLIGAAFFLFLLVVGWVLKRRVLDKVVGGVGWWVGGSARLVKMGFRGGGGGGGGGVGATEDNISKGGAVLEAIETPKRAADIVQRLKDAAALRDKARAAERAVNVAVTPLINDTVTAITDVVGQATAAVGEASGMSSASGASGVPTGIAKTVGAIRGEL